MSLSRLALGPETSRSLTLKSNKFIGLSKTNLSGLAPGPKTSGS